MSNVNARLAVLEERITRLETLVHELWDRLDQIDAEIGD